MATATQVVMVMVNVSHQRDWKIWQERDFYTQNSKGHRRARKARVQEQRVRGRAHKRDDMGILQLSSSFTPASPSCGPYVGTANKRVEMCPHSRILVPS